MKHEPAGAGQSVMIYTYTIETGPPMLCWLMAPIVDRIFQRQTRKRFACMRDFLLVHRAEIEAWQRSYHLEQHLKG